MHVLPFKEIHTILLYELGKIKCHFMGKMHVLLSTVQYARSIKYQNKILKKTQVTNPSNIPVYTYICICTRALPSRASSTNKNSFFFQIKPSLLNQNILRNSIYFN